MESSILTVDDIARIMNYEKQLGVFIFLNEDRFPKYKVDALKQEKKRISSQLKNL